MTQVCAFYSPFSGIFERNRDVSPTSALDLSSRDPRHFRLRDYGSRDPFPFLVGKKPLSLNTAKNRANVGPIPFIGFARQVYIALIVGRVIFIKNHIN